ncbi:MAG: DNA polymerase III subunit delta [Luminiphilus sp.]|nr:DNA polymerase III subunit delta [Luminiphilus sp.]
MPVKPDQLTHQLNRGLQRCYLIYGEETLIVEECADAVRGAARSGGCAEREIIEIGATGDWQQLLQSAGSMSLFADRKLIEIRLPSGKPGTEGSKAIQEYLSIDSEDVLLIIAGKIDKPSQRAKWFVRLDQEGVVVPVWPVGRRDLPGFLQQRLKAAGLTADREAVQLLADRVEGNLLAAVQEVDKLKLLADSERVTVETVLDSVLANARYNPFGLADAALSGDAGSALRTLRGLEAESTQPPVILWALARDISLLEQLSADCAAGTGLSRAMNNRGVWRNRMSLVQGAFNRQTPASIRRLQHLAFRTDSAIKGFEKGSPWDLLDQLVVLLALGPIHHLENRAG